MLVNQYMYKNPHVAQPTMTVGEAIKYMAQHKTNSLIVIDEAQHPIGLISSQILIRAAVPEYLKNDPVYSQYGPEGTLEESVHTVKDKPLSELMYTEFHTLAPDDAIIEAASYSIDSYRRILPVVDEHGVLLGALTRTCIKNALYNALFPQQPITTDNT